MGICGQTKTDNKTGNKKDSKTETKTETKTKNNIETKIKDYYLTVKSELDKCNNTINLDNSIKEEKENIITMLEAEEADDNKTKESDNSYPSFNEINCKKTNKYDIKKLNNLIKQKRQNKEKIEIITKKKKDLEEL